ncbi:MAG: AAA family ATPase [Phycisphaerales bacterium]|nr:AAA family ATPase [Phycisphaerales bacterium]
MNAPKANYRAGSDVLESWRDDVLSGNPPVIWPIGSGALANVEIGPGRVLLIGGAPGSGKTAFIMQGIIDALRITSSLRVVVCNIEMSTGVLLDRQLSRLAGVDLTAIIRRKLTEKHADRIDQAMNTLQSVADRMAFVGGPFDLENVAATVDDFGASLIVLDYIQRIAPPGKHDSRRGSVDATMNYLRQFADAGMGVVVVSAVSRAKDDKGRSSYTGSGLNLASFRESSELEFGADDAFIIHPADDDAEGDAVTLKHLKSRHGQCRDIALTFDRPHQSFTPTGDDPSRRQQSGLKADLQKMWNRTAAAGEDDDEQ